METVGKNGVDLPESPTTASESAVEKHLRSYFPDLFNEEGYKKLLSILHFSVESIPVDDEVDILSVVDSETGSSMFYLTQFEDSTLLSLNPGYMDISSKRKGFALCLAAFHSKEYVPVVIGKYKGLEGQSINAKLFLSFLYNQELSFDELANGLLYE